MKIYLSGERAQQSPSHLVVICPAGHLEGQEMPREWVDDHNNPVSLHVEFKFGVAEVPSNVGEYMLKYGMASKTKLIIPNGVKAA